MPLQLRAPCHTRAAPSCMKPKAPSLPQPQTPAANPSFRILVPQSHTPSLVPSPPFTPIYDGAPSHPKVASSNHPTLQFKPFRNFSFPPRPPFPTSQPAIAPFPLPLPPRVPPVIPHINRSHSEGRAHDACRAAPGAVYAPPSAISDNGAVAEDGASGGRQVLLHHHVTRYTSIDSFYFWSPHSNLLWINDRTSGSCVWHQLVRMELR